MMCKLQLDEICRQNTLAIANIFQIYINKSDEENRQKLKPPKEMIEETLRDIGLQEKEVTVYVALLKRGGEGSATDTSKDSDLPRTTVYDVAKSLSNKGLLFERQKGKKKVFAIDTPKHLVSYLEKQEEAISRGKEKLNKIIDDLERMQNPLSPVPVLRTFHGEDGIKTMWDEQIKATKHADSALSIICNQQFFAQFQDYLKEKSKELHPLGYTIRVLVHSHEEDPIFIKIRNLEVKATKQNYVFAAGMDIVGSFVGYWTEMDTLTGTLLEQEQIALMQRSMFETLWNTLE